MLECKKCKAPAFINNNKVIKTCQCSDIVVANLQASLTGKGNTNKGQK